MSYTARDASGLIFFSNIDLRRENEQGFEEADCQTYTHVPSPPNAVSSPPTAHLSSPVGSATLSTVILVGQGREGEKGV